MKPNALRNLHLRMEYDLTFKRCSTEKNNQKFGMMKKAFSSTLDTSIRNDF